MSLSRDRYLSQVSDESACLLATDAANLGTPIPHIEGWTVGDVIGHTGWVARYVTLLQSATPDEPVSRSAVPNPPAGTEVLAWTADAVADLIEALKRSDPDTIRPSFVGPVPAAWWVRRMAHELSMHRWDVDSASGTAGPIDPAVSADGIDEIFEVFVPTRMRFEALAANGETMHLHSTDKEDGAGEWSATLLPDRVEWDHSHSKGDVAVRGSASDLLLVMWSRIPASRLEVFGDASLIDRWQEAAAF
ncbi:MAG: maleylpyruvate isomerase N-terminal domain-containing protein [Acidimicrobiia bacterium]|nr:maleylpyruvate isomerase N-terminal domain-containing protein [Acidimicrobiia bacterium]